MIYAWKFQAFNTRTRRKAASVLHWRYLGGEHEIKEVEKTQLIWASWAAVLWMAGAATTHLVDQV